MIRVHRGQEPSVITHERQQWLDALHGAVTPEERDSALAKYKQAQIRNALRSMFHGQCAYCETKTEDAAWGHIEHYRPRKGPNAYPDRAFDWDNLLWSCPRCNSGCKGDQFPEAADDGPILNPCEDEPGDHLEFEWDSEARVASVWGRTPRGRKTEEILQLNRPELRASRRRHVLALLIAAKAANGSAEAQAFLNEAKADDAEYAAFARAIDGWPST